MKTATLFAVAIFLTSPVVTGPTESPPTQGVQIRSSPFDVRLPLSVFQCEPFLIYYDLSRGRGLSIPVDSLGDSDLTDVWSHNLIKFLIPSGVGYLEWICNIPAGCGFMARGEFEHYFVVQPGSSSSCLHNVTTTYSYVAYSTTGFESYTRHLPSGSPLSQTHAPPFPTGSITVFPTGSFATIAANPEFVIALTTFSTALSIAASSTPLHPSSAPSPTSHTFSKTPAIVGSTIGGAVVVLTFIVIFVHLRKAKTSQPEPIDRTAIPGRIEPWVPMTDQSTPTIEFSKHIGTSTRTPSRHKPVIVSRDRQPTIPIHESVNPGSNLADALNAVSRLRPNAEQRDILVTSLNVSTAPSISLPTVPQMQPTAALPQDGPSQLMDALNSFCRLTPEEKHTVVSMLRTLMTTDASAGLRTRRGDSIARAPPPYSD